MFGSFFVFVLKAVPQKEGVKEFENLFSEILNIIFIGFCPIWRS
jgi:hypothetical protein